jgi:hypothetical protein
VKPLLQALLLAERVYEDKSGKKIIAGTFNKLIFRKGAAGPREVEIDGVKMMVVPAGIRAGSPFAYISLTDVRNSARCTLRYVDLTHDKPLFQLPFDVACDDPLQTIELIIPMPELPLHVGPHAVELLCDDEPLGAFRVIVEELPPEVQDNVND